MFVLKVKEIAIFSHAVCDTRREKVFQNFTEQHLYMCISIKICDNDEIL